MSTCDMKIDLNTLNLRTDNGDTAWAPMSRPSSSAFRVTDSYEEERTLLSVKYEAPSYAPPPVMSPERDAETSVSSSSPSTPGQVVRAPGHPSALSMWRSPAPNAVSPEGEEPAVSRTIQSSGSRLLSLDLLRGFIMVIMAWDHSVDFTSDGSLPKDHGSQSWSGELSTFDGSWVLFMVRFVSHICAPGFFFLMGVGMAMFSRSRRRRRWSHLRIVWHYQVRGCVLLVLARIVNVASFLGPESLLLTGHSNVESRMGPLRWYTCLIGICEVMEALGLTMLAAGCVLPVVLALTPEKRPTSSSSVCNRAFGLRWGTCLVFLLGAACIGASQAIVVHYQGDNPAANTDEWPKFQAVADNFWKIAVRFLVLPGRYSYGIIAYAMLPWFGLCILGMAASHEFTVDPAIAHMRCLVSGVICFIVFVLGRFYGGSWMNLRGRSRGDPSSGNWFVDLFNICKYPPSIAYLLYTMSINLVLLSIFYAISQPRKREKVDAVTGLEDGLDNESRKGLESGKEPLLKSESEEKQLSSIYPVSWPLIPFLLLGRVPLFFYVMHFVYYGLISAFVRNCIREKGIYLPYCAIPFVIVVGSLMPLCHQYSKFKSSTPPESLWRLL